VRRSEGIGVAAVSAALGCWLALSPLHAHHNADSLVPVLVSLWHWTPFYWEQDRFGMLLPLLALPWRHPFGNLLAQVAMRGAALALACFLLARAVLPRGCWPVIGALAVGTLLLSRDLPFLAFFLMQPYGAAAALALGALPLLARGGAWRIAAGVLLLTVACWVAVSIVLWLLPLILLRAGLGLDASAQGRRGAALLPGAAALGGAAASVLAARLASPVATDWGAAPASDWPRGWWELGRNLVALVGPAMPVVAVASLAVALLLARRGSVAGRRSAAAASALLGTATVELLALGASGWVHRNGLLPRFQLVGALAVAMTPLAVAAVLALDGRPPHWRRASHAAVALLIAGLMLWRCGPPSLRAARAALERLPGSRGRAALAAGATHTLGDYWLVWPTAFHAEVLLDEAGSQGHLWAIAYRAGPTAARWRPASWCGARLLGLGSAAAVEAARRRYGLPPLAGSCPRLIARIPAPATAPASPRRPWSRPAG
jgi:hypothetical protein